MYPRLTKLLIFSLFLCLFQHANAQDSSEKDKPESSHFEVGLNYLSNSVYLGRRDTARVPYLTPSFSYYNKSGFYATSSLSYLNSQNVSRIDFFEIDAGYLFTVQKFSGDISVEKDFYNAQSKNVKSETKGSVNATCSYDLGFIEPLVQASVVFNKRDDYAAAFGLQHSFYLDDDNFEIIPSFLLNTSTQNYYSAYYTKRRKVANQKNQVTSRTITTAYLPSASKFKVMDYEFALSLNYTTGKFLFYFSPTLALPVNPNVVSVTVTKPAGAAVTKTETENLVDVGFWSAGVTYSFR